MSTAGYNPFSAENRLRHVLITGASMGIGEAFAREFAGRGRNLLLVARSADCMHRLAEELGGRYAVAVSVCAADLSDGESPARIYGFCKENHLDVDLLINCAGLSRAGDFDDISHEKLEEVMAVNMMAMARLTRYFAADLADGRGGGIINIASLGGLQGVPGLGLYSATKAFVMTLSEALHCELQERGVHVVAVCPGFIDTGFFVTAGHNAANLRLPISPASVVVRSAIKGLQKNRMRVLPTILDRLLVFSQRAVGREVSVRLAGYFAAVREGQ
ncbi:MAG: SDR family oxidoreductase [Chlorobiaceae bacterium]